MQHGFHEFVCFVCSAFLRICLTCLHSIYRHSSADKPLGGEVGGELCGGGERAYY
jgi:hypothetical protein